MSHKLESRCEKVTFLEIERETATQANFELTLEVFQGRIPINSAPVDVVYDDNSARSIAN